VIVHSLPPAWEILCPTNWWYVSWKKQA
jgi:hypothetical protein